MLITLFNPIGVSFISGIKVKLDWECYVPDSLTGTEIDEYVDAMNWSVELYDENETLFQEATIEIDSTSYSVKNKVTALITYPFEEGKTYKLQIQCSPDTGICCLSEKSSFILFTA